MHENILHSNNDDDNDTHDKSTSYSLVLSAPSTIVGTTVSAIVYTTIVTGGEIVAEMSNIGIKVSANLIGYGTDIVAGTIAGNAVRNAGYAYSSITKPLIANTSRAGALGISILAGTGSALATNAIIYGSHTISSYFTSYINTCKKHITSMIQYPVPLHTTVIDTEDGLQLLYDNCDDEPKQTEMIHLSSVQ